MCTRQMLVLAGAVAVLAPLLSAFMAGAAAGLAVSLLLTLALLAAGWRLLSLGPPSPVRPSPQPSPLEGHTANSPSSKPETQNPEPRPVLLVEDDPVSRRVVLRMLQRLGVSADHVADGQAAVEAVAARPYALALMDCQLPVLDGYAAAAQIRQQEAAHPQAGRTPIVALTATSQDTDRDRCIAAGMDDFLTKPLDLRRLAGVLAHWNIPHQSPSAARDPAAPATPGASLEPLPADVPPILDPAGLPLVDGRLPEPYQEIMQLFQQEAARRMAAITEAAAQSDHPLLARVAHTLAGSASSIGAARLAAASATLEALARRPHENDLGDDDVSEAIEAVRRALHELEAVLARLTTAG